ncbi:MAG TPA: hypothetical protein ENK16_00045 [Chromatiales bacterium]|nr:hypothetical protein [Chromatiales bacterium]
MKTICTGVIVLALSVIAISVADAALIGILPATPGGTDYQAYYDEDIDVTWAADANLFVTQSFGLTPNPFNPGNQTYSTMNTWLGMLNSMNGGAGYLGANGWRFPFTPASDPDCSDIITTPYLATYGSGCTAGEFSHLFNVHGITTTSEGPFVNVEKDGTQFGYWSSVLSDAHTVAYNFRFETGELFPSTYNSGGYAWPVHDGNLAAVPVPAVGWLFGSGLIMGLLRTRRQNPVPVQTS